MRKLYLECSSGISGDMTVAALLDLGADEVVLRSVLDGILAAVNNNFEINIYRTSKCGIDACKFDVIANEEHTHRHLKDIYQIINDSDMTSNAKTLAKKMFEEIALAEAKAHGIEVEKVHFHEVGAIDSIVDIVSTAVCIDNLKISDVIITSISEGTGYVNCAHGKLPVPVPAVVNILSKHRLPIRNTNNAGEMITPTGAAIAATLCTSRQLPVNYTIERIGIGAGTKDFETPNVLRAMIIDAVDSGDSKNETANVDKNESLKAGVWVLETNIDDCTGEALAYTFDELFENGALDVYYQPIYMKKNRPAYMLGVICDTDRVTLLEDIIFANTTSIGIRKHYCERRVLERKYDEIKTSLGVVQVKICDLDNSERIYPEYESVKKIAKENGIGYVDAYRQICCEIMQ